MSSNQKLIALYRQRMRWGWVGLALQPIAILIIGSINELDSLSPRGIAGSLVWLLSLFLMNWGIWNYAKGKGYGNWIAALSLFNVYGLLIIVCLPNKNR